MSRRKIAAANWKMNTILPEGEVLIDNLLAHSLDKNADVVLCVPFTHLQTLNHKIKDNANVHLGAQNMSEHDKGAYTGEISASMLKAVGVTHIVIGHSERREYFNEGDELLGLKLKVAVENGLIPIFCCGEQLSIRKAGQHIQHVLGQLSKSFEGFTENELSDLVIAYEPIWAIGTGETASPQQAQDMQASIRQFLSDRFSLSFAHKVPILYGGSVKPNNAEELFGQMDVDGGLVGGASLDAEGFANIINSFS